MRLELSIIIVNWNSRALLRRSVESVIASPPTVEYEIVIVDNASTDDSVAMLGASELTRELTHQGCLRIIENSENRGFGPANNQAFGLPDAPLLLLLIRRSRRAASIA